MEYSNIQDRVNNSLRDFSDLEWVETEIKYLINEGYREFCRLTHCMRKHGKITVTTDTGLYDMPADGIMLYRVSWDGRVLPFTSTFRMDSMSDWRNTTKASNLLSIIQDAEGYSQIRVYPMISSSTHIGNLVLGTDGNTYACKKNHTSASASNPITGDDYADYWRVLTTTWVTGTVYGWGDYVVDTGGNAAKCILGHKSSSDNKPTSGSTSSTNWAEDEDTGSTWATGTEYKKHKFLELDYAYYPHELSNDSDKPLIPEIYHQALSEYAIYECLQINNSGQQDYTAGYIHYKKFRQYVARAKVDTARLFVANKSSRIAPVKFL